MICLKYLMISSIWIVFILVHISYPTIRWNDFLFPFFFMEKYIFSQLLWKIFGLFDIIFKNFWFWLEYFGDHNWFSEDGFQKGQKKRKKQPGAISNLEDANCPENSRGHPFTVCSRPISGSETISSITNSQLNQNLTKT